MTFQTYPISLTGPSYQSRSKPLSSQQTKNWYQQFNESGKDAYVLLPFPGLKPLDKGNGQDRGFTVMAEVLYQVKGNVLYSIDKDGKHSLKGSIPNGERCIFANDGINLFVVADGRVWRYKSDTNTITEVTDPNITGAKSVDFFNNQFIYTKDKFSTVSDVGDGSSANGLNIIGAESRPDALVRDYVFEEVIYRFGTRTTESWYNSGVGSPPISRIQNQIFQVGLKAIHSVANTDDAMYWLGDDNAVYRASGGTRQRISTDAISNALESYSETTDAIASTFTMQGQNFYVLTFPTENKTWVLNEVLAENGWFEIASGVDQGIYQGTSFASVYGKNYVADVDNGNVYQLDLDTYTNNDEPLQRVRVSQSINGDLLGAKGKRIQMSRLEIIMESGVGLLESQGSNPRIMIEASFDGGRTWSAGNWARTGRLGEFVLKVEWFCLKSFYDMIIRVSATDPVNYSIYSAAIDLRLAGR